MSIILDACFIGQRFEVEVSRKRERLYRKHQNRKKERGVWRSRTHWSWCSKILEWLRSSKSDLIKTPMSNVRVNPSLNMIFIVKYVLI